MGRLDVHSLAHVKPEDSLVKSFGSSISPRCIFSRCGINVRTKNEGTESDCKANSDAILLRQFSVAAWLNLFACLLSFSSGGLRLKRDITEYGEFLRSFHAPSIDEKFEALGILANVFIVAPESLSTLFEGTPSIRKDAQRMDAMLSACPLPP
ncbi:hypothetical protein Cgig2_029678 [Carnegiea gigantea]|uniref:Exocyst complex component Sec10-like alpha-helical bundle domain-containing protein n=1 Tax=Carnegiea gigantea TaxID=171969 RepID=A0A9Q1QIG0_9CARY|nr:hypothetical protein Cgig2_029678 [Carnegiea gigantea]